MLKWTFKVSPTPPNLSTAKLTAHCTFPWSLRTRLYQCFPLFGYHGSTCSTLRIGCIDPCTEQRWQRLALWSAGGLGLPGPRGGTRGSRGRGWARHHWRGCTATEAGTPDFDLVWPRCGAGGRRERWEVMARWDDEVGIGKKLGFLLVRGVAIAKACHDEDTDVQVGARGWRSITFLEAFPTLIWHMWTLSILLTKVHHARCILAETRSELLVIGSPQVAAMKCMKAMGPEMDGDTAGPSLKKAKWVLKIGWNLDVTEIEAYQEAFNCSSKGKMGWKGRLWVSFDSPSMK